MKYLEYTPLDRINHFLSCLNLGERTIKGCLEAYSCKHTGTDKKLSLSLENEDKCAMGEMDTRHNNEPNTSKEIEEEDFNQEINLLSSRVTDLLARLFACLICELILDYLGKSSDTDSSSPVEYLFSRSSRKTLIYLLLTLNHLYPDYDFSAVRAHEFFTEENWDSFKQIFEVYMFEASKEWLMDSEGVPLLETLYKALDEVVKLAECEVYSYNPEAEADPFLEKGAIWSYHFFFYNRKLKRVVSFRFSCLSNLAGEWFFVDELSREEDGEIFDGMDI